MQESFEGCKVDSFAGSNEEAVDLAAFFKTGQCIDQYDWSKSEAQPNDYIFQTS